MFNLIPSKDLDFAYSYLKQHFISKVYEVLEEAYVYPGTNVRLQCIRDLLQTYHKVMDAIAIDLYDRGPVQTKLSIGRTAKFTAKRLVELLEYNEMIQRKVDAERDVNPHDGGDSDLGEEVSDEPWEPTDGFGYPNNTLSAFQEVGYVSEDAYDSAVDPVLARV